MNVSSAVFTGVALVSAVCLCAGVGSAAVVPGPLFGDNMVLQRDKPVVVWGTAEPGKTVTVEFAGQKKSAVTDSSKHWKLTLDPMPVSSEPRKLQVSSSEFKISFTNVLVGEVWFAGGQSNMRFALWSSDGAKQLFESGQAEIPMLRIFAMPEIVNELDRDLPIGGWKESAKDDVGDFSAVAWYFGRDLQNELKVPVGVIMSARGGTPAEAWMDPADTADCPAFAEYAADIGAQYLNAFQGLEEYVAAYKQFRIDWQTHVDHVQAGLASIPPAEPVGPYSSQRPGGLYSTMIRPLAPFTIRGFLWYQGEGNCWRAYDYRFVLETLIRDWRRDFNDSTLPFLVVQLPGFGCDGAEHPIWAVVRDSQAAVAANDPSVGLISIPELGDELNIHPTNKSPVGERLARFARRAVYGEKIQYVGPSFDSVEFNGGKATVSLKDAGGLVRRGDVIHGFTVAGADQKFVPATAELNGEQVVINSPDVKDPVAVRYLWSNWIDPAEVNLFNGADFPLAPFRTDDFKVITQK